MGFKPVRIYQWLNDAAVFGYKLVGIPVLATLMLWTLSYLSLTGFYLLSDRWVVPFIAGPGQERVIREGNAYADRVRMLHLLRENRNTLANEIQNQVHANTSYVKEFVVTVNSLLSQEQSNLIEQKLINPLATKPEDFGALRNEIKRKYQRRMITSDQQQRDIASVNRQEFGYRKRGLFGKNPPIERHVAEYRVTEDRDRFVESIMKEELDPSSSRLVRDLLGINTQIKKAKDQIELLTGQVKRVDEEIAYYEPMLKRLESSPFVKATQENIPLAFVPYDNSHHVRAGSKVYGCKLYFFFCRKVGTVSEIVGNDETTWNHPFFSTPLRGSLVRLSLSEGGDVKQMILVLNRPPLFW